MLHFRFLVLLLCACIALPLQAASRLSVEIQGVDGKMLENVKQFLTLEQRKNHERLDYAQIQRYHQKAEQEIQNALAPFGYYQVTVVGTLKDGPENEEGKATWIADYAITPGPQMMFKTVQIKVSGAGENDPELLKIIQKSELKPGTPVVHSVYDQLKQHLEDYAEEYGYQDANFISKKLRIYPEQNYADVDLHFATGPRYRFGEVSFEPLEEGDPELPFADEFLHRFLPFETDSPFSLGKMTEFREILTDSDYFRSTRVENQEDAENKHINLKVRLKPHKQNRYKIRAGYGTDTSARMQLTWDRRYIGKYGHNMQTDLYTALTNRVLLLNTAYEIPYNIKDQNFLRFSARYMGQERELDTLFSGTDALSDEQLSTYKATREHYLSLSAQHQRKLKLFGFELLENAGVVYHYSDDNLLSAFPDAVVQDLNDRYPEWVPIWDSSYRLLTPRVLWRYLKTDNPVYSRHGTELVFQMQGAREGWGSTHTFWQTRLSSKVIRSTSRNGRIILRNDVAYTDAEVKRFDADTEFVTLPSSLLFLTGGDRSVRGYGFENLAGNSGGRGARHLFTASIEYEHKIATDWSVAAFVDAGNVFNDFNEMDLHIGPGVGVRWNSPVGPVRLDIASPLDDDTSSFRVHLNIGPDFYTLSELF